MYISLGIYNELYDIVINKYAQHSKHDIFKYLSIDSSFFPNKNCPKLGRNIQYKSKKGLKISAIVDSQGIPLAICALNGCTNDCATLDKTYNNMLVDTEANNYSDSNRHKQYILADSGYDSKNNKQFCEKKGYTFICPPNNRNTKDVNKKRVLNEKQKKIYKKRTVVENTFSWIKNYSKLLVVNEKSMNNFLNVTKMAFCNIITKRFKIFKKST